MANSYEALTCSDIREERVKEVRPTLLMKLEDENKDRIQFFILKLINY